MKRIGGVGSAAKAGIIASSKGSDRETPAPRRNARRDSASCEVNVTFFISLLVGEAAALNDFVKDGADSKILRLRLCDDSLDDFPVSELGCGSTQIR